MFPVFLRVAFSTLGVTQGAEDYSKPSIKVYNNVNLMVCLKYMSHFYGYFLLEGIYISTFCT